MAKKLTPTSNRAKKAAILKELESVKALLNEDINSNTTNSGVSRLSEPLNYTDPDYIAQQSETSGTKQKKEFQIPLLDPGKTSTDELDFTKKESQSAQNSQSPKKTINPDDIPTINDITASSSLFDEEEKGANQSYTSKVAEKQLKDQAQLLIQDIINDAITEIEEKLDDLMPNLEDRLIKRLEKSMDEYITKTLEK